MMKISYFMTAMLIVIGLSFEGSANAQPLDISTLFFLDAYTGVATLSAPDPLRIKLLDQADTRVRRAKIGLIASAVAIPLGLSSVIVAGLADCRENGIGGDLNCGPGGKAGLGIGGILFYGGAISMLTTGIMLGVRKRQRRKLHRELNVAFQRRRVSWDPFAARLRF